MKNIRFHLIIIGLLTAFCSQSQIFYRIEGPELSQPSYLFGTHHMAPVSILAKNHVLERIDSVQQIIGEIDLTEYSPMGMGISIMKYMKAPSDSTLSVLLSEEEYSSVNETLKEWSPLPGADLKMFENMKPMVVSSLIELGVMSSLMENYDPQNQLDSYILNYGKEKGKSTVGLETPEFQAEVLYNSIPVSQQAAQLVSITTDIEKVIEEARSLNSIYIEGDLDLLSKLSENEFEDPEFKYGLLEARNENWLEKIPNLIQEKPSLIVVGALHLPGENGILEGLITKGFNITPIE